MDEKIIYERKHLFRGKLDTRDKEKQRWCYGVPVPIRENTRLTDRIELFASINYDELDPCSPELDSEEIKPETLCRFTGKYDIDNTPIYEHDILEVKFGGFLNNNQHIISEVVWVESRTGFVFKYNKFGGLFTLNVLGKDWCSYYKVVGNIFDGYEIGGKRYECGNSQAVS